MMTTWCSSPSKRTIKIKTKASRKQPSRNTQSNHPSNPSTTDYK